MKLQKPITLGIAVAAIVLAGCGKNDSNNPGTPPAPTNAALPPPVVQPMPAAAGTNQPMTDAEIRQKIVGTWTLNDGRNKGLLTINADGTLVAKDPEDTNNVMQISWLVTNGLFIVSGTDQGGPGSDTNTITTLNDHDLTFDDKGDSVTFHR